MANRDIEFEWDPKKAASNFYKHGVTFEEATKVFYDEERIEEEDYTSHEARWRTLGISKAFLLLLVVNTVKENGNETIRIISARRASSAERKKYHGRRKLG